MRPERNFFTEFVNTDGDLSEKLGTLGRFVILLVCVVLLFSATFQFIMFRFEDQSLSFVTALYWTLVTMSTVGFGDIVFVSDVGRFFTLVVLVSGIPLLLVILPAIFIRVLYAPWLEKQMRQEIPDRLPAPISGHVIITRYGPIAAGLIERLALSGIPYVVV